jgi:hypothetical protein
MYFLEYRGVLVQDWRNNQSVFRKAKTRSVGW